MPQTPDPLKKKRPPFRAKDGPNDIDIYVGQRLRMRRSAMGMTQEELAGASGLTFQQIQKYEQAKNRISASRLHQFSQILSVDVNFFFAGINTPKAVSVSGLSEEQAPFEGPDSISNREMAELLKTYNGIGNIKMRRDFIKMMRQMSVMGQIPLK